MPNATTLVKTGRAADVLMTADGHDVNALTFYGLTEARDRESE